MSQISLLPVVLALVVAVDAGGPGLRSDTLVGWRAYVAAVETRRSAERLRRDPFLVTDSAATRARDRTALMRGDVVVARMTARGRDRREIGVPSAMVHHWRGTIFLPGANLDALMTRLEARPPRQDDVLAWKILRRGPGALEVYLRLRRSKIVTVVYNTEHVVAFERVSATRAETRSTATKIAEVADPNTSNERELPSGEDRGFLWKLNAYWRYEAVPGGVIAECESISLSRAIPFGLGTIVGPLVESTAKESLEKTLRALKIDDL